ncbi:MAG: hypothetical protein GF398_05800 [Chitinivibrionales bacterium]|nr:hypothetical protein [Chitinivibrionales bacterium]
MVRHAKEYFTLEVKSNDTHVGTVKDLYFDQEEWRVRYIAVEYEEALQTRTALISVEAVSSVNWEERILKTSASQQKVYNSPQTDIDLPVSREYELALHRYYEWPEYWGQVSFLDTPRAKHMPDPEIPYEDGVRAEGQMEAPNAYTYGEGDYETAQTLAVGEADDDEMQELEFASPAEERSYSSSIHSAARLGEFRIYSDDEHPFACTDILLVEEDWAVRYLMLKPRLAITENPVLLPVGQIRDLHAASSEIVLALSKDEINKTPQYTGKTALKAYEHKLYAYYNKRGMA